MAAQAQGIKLLRASWTDDPQLRIAVALESLAGCTGWLDEHGGRQHDGDTCPVHEGQDLGEDATEDVSFLDEWRAWWWRNFG